MPKQSDTVAHTTTRARGRPRADETGGEQLRQAVIAATATVYAEHGYHQTTVARILEAANVSRPTFYKLFSNRHEVIERVVARANAALRDKVMRAVMPLSQVESLLRAGVDAYFDWCREMGPLVGPIYSEINDPVSPVGAYRDRTIAGFVSLFDNQAERLGQPRLDPLLYDSLLRAVEHAGSSAFWPQRLSEQEIERRRAVALRIMLGALATADSIHRVPPLQSVMQAAP